MNTEGKLKLLKAVAKIYCGITVQQFNQMFAGKTEYQIHRHLKLAYAEAQQIYGGQRHEQN
jgi:hypothetical protein